MQYAQPAPGDKQRAEVNDFSPFALRDYYFFKKRFIRKLRPYASCRTG